MECKQVLNKSYFPMAIYTCIYCARELGFQIPLQEWEAEDEQ